MLDDLSTAKINSLYRDRSIYAKNFLSTGGQKKVYVGKKNDLDVVIKFIPTENSSLSRRAEREVKCMNGVNSQHLVQLIDCFEDYIDEQNVVVLIEEYIEGESLREIIEKQPSLNIALNVLETLLKLLQEFDEKGIIHRDIKPENIIISNNRGPVLLDFGIARLLSETSITATAFPMAPGTLAYAAPEQIQNNKDLQNVRTDLFSCGIVFFETATGSHPYESEDYEELIELILEGQRKSFKNFFPDIPFVEILDELFYKLTNPNLFERYRKPKYALEHLYNVREAINNEE